VVLFDLPPVLGADDALAFVPQSTRPWWSWAKSTRVAKISALF